MATQLTAAHRSWRVKIFASTWLAYVGFYFCRKPFSAAKKAIGEEAGWTATDLANIWAAYLIAYAVGQFLASGMGTKLGPRRNVMLGMAVSIAVTILMGVTLSIPVMAGLCAINGLAQATGWSGNVGTMASWFHKHERGRVMGAWSTNFTIGSLASGWTAWWVLQQHDAGEAVPWRWTFYLGAIVLSIIWLQFYLFQRNKPEDVGLAPVDDPKTAEDESKIVDPPGLGLSRTAWTNLLLVAGFYFFVKFIRYAVWSWSAYFLGKNYQLSDYDAALYSTLFDVFGIAGVFATGYLSDKFFGSRRAGISLIFMVGMLGATGALVLWGDHSATTFALLLGAVGFFLYGPDALLTGAGAIDIGGRRAAVFAAAVISGFGSIGPVIQEVVIGRMYDAKKGELGPIFELIFTCAALSTLFCAVLVWRNRKGDKGV
jgi:OPA family sugar phosphate sensor protein UhpC-like MFS transporter